MRTRDGHILRVPKGLVSAVARQKRSSTRRAAGTVSRLAKHATSSGLSVQPGERRPLRRFSGGAGGRRFDLLGKPIGPREHVLVTIRVFSGEAEGEFEKVPSSVTATVTWQETSRRFAWRGAEVVPVPRLSKSKGGIYIVEKNSEPIYVGETNTFHGRWRGRLRVFRELRFSEPDWSAYRLRVGALDRRGRSTRLGVERVLIRYLKEKKRKNLTNRQSTREFKVGAGGLHVTNAGARPSYLPATPLSAPAGVSWEISPVWV